MKLRQQQNNQCAPGRGVAQIFNLLYRRIVFGRARNCAATWNFGTPADCKSAIQQIENLRYVKQRTRGFTLAEVLAALVFMAIVIPVVVQALHVASGAGEVAVRKNEAARVAERVLNESLATGTWNQSDQSGTVEDGTREFSWTVRNEPWSQNPIRLLTAEVKYTVQGNEYSVHLSTLADSSSSSTNSF
jgi:type II secretory pathway pseudopilin PulG